MARIRTTGQQTAMGRKGQQAPLLSQSVIVDKTQLGPSLVRHRKRPLG